MQAAGMFAAGVSSVEVARRLRVSEKSVRAWRAKWRDGGESALVSAGGPKCRLSVEQRERLTAVLDAGPAAAGWSEDQRWTLARVVAVVESMFGVSYTIKGMSLLLRRLGYSPQVPKRRAAQRDQAQVSSWQKVRWPAVKG